MGSVASQRPKIDIEAMLKKNPPSGVFASRMEAKLKQRLEE